MQSRRDQVQAYFFVVGRLVSAVVHGKPDSLQLPNRRYSTGTVLGVLLSVVIAGVFGIVGLFVPGGNTDWKQPGAIVMNEDNGARYVYLENRLRPVLNYSSALLASGSGGSGVQAVSQDSLDGTPVGQPIGIPGAPDALPPAETLATGPWTTCLAGTSGGSDAEAGSSVTLMIDEGEGTPVTGSEALLVSTPDDQLFLLTQGRRHLVPDRSTQVALGYGSAEPIPVSPAWLNPVPQGKDLRVPPTADVGRPGPDVDGRQSTVGQIYQVRNPAADTDQYYVARTDDLVPVSPTVAALLLAAPDTKTAYGSEPVAPVEVGPAALQGPDIAERGELSDGLPDAPPDLVALPPDQVPCLRFGPSPTGDLIPSAETLPLRQVQSAAAPVPTTTAGTSADRVSVPSGSGVLARELAAPGAEPGTTYLVTETGMRYPIANTEATKALGYDESKAMNIPGELLNLLPQGPLLDQQTALSGGPAGSS